jgi:UDP-N-acetylmuramoyl-L-alanyl-D-glutamate--2,6-diaminopimelate ligase
LKTINDIRTKTEQLLLLDGGNRDKTKRPIMAGSASELSDSDSYLDNPRNEDPEVIIRKWKQE